MKRQKHFLLPLNQALCKPVWNWQMLKAAQAAAFFIYCSCRDEGARIFFSIIATAFKVAAVSPQMTHYTKFIYLPKTYYGKAATCERQQLAAFCLLVFPNASVRFSFNFGHAFFISLSGKRRPIAEGHNSR